MHFATEGAEGAEDTEWDKKMAMALIAQITDQSQRGLPSNNQG